MAYCFTLATWIVFQYRRLIGSVHTLRNQGGGVPNDHVLLKGGRGVLANDYVIKNIRFRLHKLGENQYQTFFIEL